MQVPCGTTVLGEDGLRGFKVALAEINNEAGGRPIEVIIAATDASGMQAMGKVMGILKPKLQGRADMGAVSATVKERLGAL